MIKIMDMFEVDKIKSHTVIQQIYKKIFIILLQKYEMTPLRRSHIQYVLFCFIYEGQIIFK